MPDDFYQAAVNQFTSGSRQHELFRPMILAWLFASIQWAEARALYGLNLAFLGLVHEEHRAEIQSKLKGLERKLRMSPPS